MEIVLILLTILASGFFSGSEIAFVSANRLKLEIESRKPSVIAAPLRYFREHPDTFLTTTLVGNNIINVLYATLMALFLAEPIETLYVQFLGSVPSESVVLLIQTFVAAVVIMLLGEILPKAIYRSQADFLIKVVTVPLRVIYFLLYPLIVAARGSSNMLIRLLKVSQSPGESIFRRQDMEMIFKELKDSGGGEDFDKEDSQILHNVLEMSNIRVKESMVPRTEMVAIDKDASLEDLQELFISSGHSKIPVYEDSIDNVIGVVFAYDLFRNPTSIAEILRPVQLIPASKKSKNLLTEFRQTNSSVAIVIDEYGGTAGLITIEDLLEELVGDIQDEYDTDDETMRKLDAYSYLLSGTVELDELEEVFPELRFDTEDTDYETVAGLIIHHLGRIPKVREEIMIQDYTFIIMKARPSKLETVKLIVNQPE